MTRKKIDFRVKRNGTTEYEIRCCGQKMTPRAGRSKHWNDDPVNFRCEKCGSWWRANCHHFTQPPPAHMNITLEEVRK